MDNKVKEKRKFPRISCYVGVNYKVLMPTLRESFTSETKNISAGGIRIVLLKELPIGTTIELKFLLPDFKHEITTKGRVVWLKDLPVQDKELGKVHEAGVEFVYIKPEDQELIKSYVLKRL